MVLSGHGLGFLLSNFLWPYYSSNRVLIDQQSAPIGDRPALWQGRQAARILAFEHLCKRVTIKGAINAVFCTHDSPSVLSEVVCGRWTQSEDSVTPTIVI